MQNNTILNLAVVATGGVIIAFIAYYIARFMRGTIKLSLPRTAFNPGDTITGSIDLHAKKTIHGNKLIVRLIGVQETSTYKNGETQTQSQEIYRNEILVEEEKYYHAGAKATYNFEISTPSMQSSEFQNSKLGQVLSTAFTLINNTSTKFKWKVEARLDAKGVDLATSKPIYFNAS